MGSTEWLDVRMREIAPTDLEQTRLQDSLDLVRDVLSPEVAIAEIHPCGSAAKRTNLRGRDEGDLVVIMHEAPTPQTLEQFRYTLSRAPKVDHAEIKYKAVATKLKNGVSVDVLPAAQYGLTEDGGSIPRKHRHALDGPKHVEWFKQAGHATSAHGVVRLVKHWRDVHDLPLTSFGLEVLTVDVLRGVSYGSSDVRFQAVLERLAAGGIQVVDPVRSSNWINQLSGQDAQRVVQAAKKSLEFLRQGNTSHVFAGLAYPSSVSGLAGAPLA